LHTRITTEQKFNLYGKFNLYKTLNTKKRCEPRIVRTADYDCAFVLVMAVLIIFHEMTQLGLNLHD